MIWFELDDVKLQVIESAAHTIKPVLRLSNYLVKPIFKRPNLLLLSKRPEKSLPSPISARTAEPTIENPPVLEHHAVLKAGY